MTALAHKPSYKSPEYDNYLRERRCGDKTQYSGEMVARNAAVALGWAHPDELIGMEAYYCKYCDFWHVGHPYYRLPQNGV